MLGTRTLERTSNMCPVCFFSWFLHATKLIYKLEILTRCKNRIMLGETALGTIGATSLSWGCTSAETQPWSWLANSTHRTSVPIHPPTLVLFLWFKRKKEAVHAGLDRYIKAENGPMGCHFKYLPKIESVGLVLNPMESKNLYKEHLGTSSIVWLPRL